MSKNKYSAGESEDSSTEETSQKWFGREDLQDLAKIGGDILKKTVATGKEVFKEVKENFPKEASHFIAKGKDEILKGLSQDMARKMLFATIEKIFTVASEHKLEFSISLQKKTEEKKNKKRILRKKKN